MTQLLLEIRRAFRDAQLEAKPCAWISSPDLSVTCRCLALAAGKFQSRSTGVLLSFWLPTWLKLHALSSRHARVSLQILTYSAVEFPAMAAWLRPFHDVPGTTPPLCRGSRCLCKTLTAYSYIDNLFHRGRHDVVQGALKPPVLHQAGEQGQRNAATIAWIVEARGGL